MEPAKTVAVAMARSLRNKSASSLCKHSSTYSELLLIVACSCSDLRDDQLCTMQIRAHDSLIQNGVVLPHVIAQVHRLISAGMRELATPFDNDIQLFAMSIFALTCERWLQLGLGT